MLLPSQDCEFLEAFERHGSLAELARALNLDKGFVSRKMSKIAGSAPVLTKVQGKWLLTGQGIDLIKWYKEAKEKQKTILTGKTELVIGTTQLFSERKLTEKGAQLLKATGFSKLKVLSNFGALDSALLSGKVDLIISCDIPHSPEIRYKKFFSSPYVVVRPSSWRGEFHEPIDLFKKPYVVHTGIDVRELLKIESSVPAPIASFDHLVGVREAVSAGMGWAILPEYASAREVLMKKIVEVPEIKIAAAEQFQLWWLPGKMESSAVSALLNLLK
jgi:DNA-binding transcriptional LysR family regulator